MVSRAMGVCPVPPAQVQGGSGAQQKRISPPQAYPPESCAPVWRPRTGDGGCLCTAGRVWERGNIAVEDRSGVTAGGFKGVARGRDQAADEAEPAFRQATVQY